MSSLPLTKIRRSIKLEYTLEGLMRIIVTLVLQLIATGPFLKELWVPFSLKSWNISENGTLQRGQVLFMANQRLMHSKQKRWLQTSVVLRLLMWSKHMMHGSSGMSSLELTLCWFEFGMFGVKCFDTNDCSELRMLIFCFCGWYVTGDVSYYQTMN